MNSDTDKSLIGMDRAELVSLMRDLGESAYRSTQIAEAVYRQRLDSLDEISTIPLQLRSKLNATGFSVGLPEIEKKFQSQDGTVRYLFSCRDGQTVETVWMPEGDGGETEDGTEADEEFSDASPRLWNRATICVSSQVGCAVDCQFCLTALLGVKRNLTAGEIAGQVCAVMRDQQVQLPQDRLNLVFMGMG